MATLGTYRSWCKDKEVSPSHSVVLEGVTKVGFSEDTVLNHLKDISAGVKVTDHQESATNPDTFNILCTFKVSTDKVPLPSTIKVTEGIEWKVVILHDKEGPTEPPKDGGEFDKLLQAFLKAQGQEGYLEKLKAAPAPAVVQQVTKHSRKIQPFSGKKPVPKGEWDFETWEQVVRQSVLDSSMSAADKHRMVVDSLMPPALDVATDPTITTADGLVGALQKAYGVVADGDDLYAEFRDTYQRSDETPSEYLIRLNGTLQKAIKHGGISAACGNKARLDQFVRGCIFHEEMIFTLQLHIHKSNPPNYVDLLQTLRGEETRRAERERRRGEATATKKQVKIQQHSTASATDAKSADLERQVKALQKELAAMRASKSAPPPPKQTKGKYFCYRCGQDGHTHKDCTGAINAQLVQLKLMARANKQGNSREPPRRDERGAQ